MAVLRSAHPYWLDRPHVQDVARYPILRSEVRVDVAIIGGGITGATLAHMLTADGLSVAVVEGLRVGRGSTLASTALLMQVPDEDVMALARRHSPAKARRMWRLSRDASDGFIDLIKRLRIQCELASRDSIYFTLDQESSLAQEYRLRRAAHLGGRWLGRTALQRVAGLSGVAIRTTGNAQVDPYKVCLGLTEHAARHGAHIFEHTPAVEVERRRGEMTITTPHGRIRTGRVVVATGFATPEFHPLFARFQMRHTYVLVTEPLPRKTRQQIGLGEVMLWDTDRPYHYARWTSDHRLMLGGGDRPRVHGRARRRAFREGTEAVRAYFIGLYPALAQVRFDYAWEGLFATTPDGLPYIGPHRRYPGHLFALGYGGNGMTFSFLAARLIRERLAGLVTGDHELFAFGRMRRT